MNRDERTLARTLFQNQIFKADGQKFEDIFTAIMNYAEPDFRSIKPWGNIGDRKNDGYVKSKGLFFQVFAPEDIRKSYLDTINKLKTDFNNLRKQWSQVNEFYFVVNDKYKGINADCEQTIENIKQEYQLQKAGFKTAKDLENLLFTLDDDQIFSIVGFLPDPNNINLDYSILNEVIRHLMDLSLPKPKESENIYPDWDEKIQFNGLKGLSSQYLNDGFLQVGALEKYLNNQSNFFADEIKDKIRKIYFDKKKNFQGNDLFWEMVNFISPEMKMNYQVAAIVLMAKYFETCDIFEEPK